ncbi:MAG TPA: MFS transporter, partial [Candidatus Dormibacteraeota bacterium]|nr:MFS transporter [Candidatus Dormibacteraeota bacterium]
PPAARAFPWYLAGTSSWFASSGMQTIVFPWLVTVVLHEPAARVGIAQMSLMAPSIFLMLLGGAVADRADCRRLLVRGHLVAALPPLLLGAAIAGGWLAYGGLIAYALAVGTAGAFVMPARDAMLTRVAAGGLGRAVAVMTATQFAAQLVGIAVGGSAGTIGAPALLLLQAAVLAFGGIAALRLPAAPPMAGAAARSRLGAMRDGLRAAAESSILVPVLIANLAVGVLYVGAFLVILPLVVRDVYGGGSAQLSLVSLGFWGGTIGSTLVQIRLGALRRPGRAIVVALFLGAGVLAAMAWPSPFPAFVALCLVWGLGAGVVMTQARTLVQSAAPETHRARILSLFQLGLMGGAPVGALLIGYLAALTGPRGAAVYPATCMLLVLAGLLLRSRLWQQGEAR